MPKLEQDFRHQKAVLWEANGVDDYGNYKVDSKQEIDVRWDEGLREGINPQGKVIAIDVMAVVGQEIPIGSIMWLGCIDDLPSTPVDLKQVVNYTETPDIKGRTIYRTVSLISYSDELPTVND